MHPCITDELVKLLAPHPCVSLLCTKEVSSSAYLSISHANGAMLIGEVLMPDWIYQ